MKRALWAVGMAILGSAAMADMTANFEALTASAGGTVLTGQDGWTLPAGADYFVFTYAGNALGHPTLPVIGGNNFAGAEMTVNLNRGQHDTAYAGGVYSQVAYFCQDWNTASSTGPFSNGLGFSMQPSASAQFSNMVIAWNTGDGTDPADFPILCYQIADDLGNDLGASFGVFQVPLATPFTINHWYRVHTVVNFTSGRYLSFSVTDMNTGTTVVDTATFSTPPDPVNFPNVMEWWIGGGPNNIGGRGLPTAMRMFLGGGTGASFGNQGGFDWMRMEAGFYAIANSCSPAPGATLAGDVRNTYEDDAQRYEARPGVALTTALPPLSINMAFTCIFATPSALSVEIDANASTGGIQRTVEIKRAGTTTWDVMTGGAAANLPTTDAVITATAPGTPSTYVDPATGLVEVRMRCRSTGPVLVYPWRARIDMARIKAAP